MEKEYKVFEAEVKESSEKDLTVVHFISTERRDRGRDILYANGMKMEGRPVVLFQHGFNDAIGSEPIAKPLWIKPGEFKNRKGIQAKTQFYPDDLGKRLWQKTVEGYMPNWSVGWRPLRHEFKTEKDGVEIRHVYEWELLEYSLVAVPMQPDAQTLPGKEVEQIYIKMLPELEEKRGELIAWKRDDDAWEEKPYPNEHACRLEDPGKYIRIRRENDKFGAGIHAIWGVQAGSKPVELQAIRFSSDKFTAAEARAWLKSHDYKCKMFEPATGKCEVCGEDAVWEWTDFAKDEGEYVCGNSKCVKFPSSPELTVCQGCKASFQYEDIFEASMGYVKCPNCGKFVDQTGKVLEDKDNIAGFFNQGVMLKTALDEILKLKADLAAFSARLSALSEAEEKRAKEAERQPSEPRTVTIVNAEEQRREVSKQITDALSSTIGKVIKETVKEEFDRVRGKVK